MYYQTNIRLSQRINELVMIDVELIDEVGIRIRNVELRCGSVGNPDLPQSGPVSRRLEHQIAQVIVAL